MNNIKAGKDFIPFKIIDLELSLPISEWNEFYQQDVNSRQRVLVYVRLHSKPLGIIELTLSKSILTVEKVANLIWQDLKNEINAHLRQDGLSEVNSLVTGLLTDLNNAPCLNERTVLLEHAPKVSVLVATHNRPLMLANCLNSLLSMEYPDFDIIVVDSAPSDDATKDMISRDFDSFANIHYVREMHPGLGRAHNRGLEEVQTRYVAITDDDVLVDRYWLIEMVKGFTVAKNVGCVTGSIFSTEIQTQPQYWIERSAGFTKGFSRKVYNLLNNRFDHPLFPYAAGIYGSGANMAFDTAILRATGGFDGCLGAGSMALGGDDLAAFFQIVAKGFTLIYEPAAIVYHRYYREYSQLQRTAYGYGAGLTAYLMKIVVDNPVRLFDLTWRIPYGMYYALSGKSSKNSRKTADYPRELNWMERRGMMVGPFLYLKSRWNAYRSNEVNSNVSSTEKACVH